MRLDVESRRIVRRPVRYQLVDEEKWRCRRQHHRKIHFLALFSSCCLSSHYVWYILADTFIFRHPDVASVGNLIASVLPLYRKYHCSVYITLRRSEHEALVAGRCRPLIRLRDRVKSRALVNLYLYNTHLRGARAHIMIAFILYIYMYVNNTIYNRLILSFI